jgi:hypothetical protein
LFPRSRTFGRYHLGFLDKEETNEIEILSGAFMFMRKAALDEAGYLDEAFFMYGEDIDLSYRIFLAGYKVIYHPKTRIIHYRGESTKKSSINYVFVFYQAMIIFANKHFSQKNARLFSFLIRIAVYLRAAFSLVNRLVSAVWLPLTDALVMFAGMYFLKDYWAARSGIFYPMEFLWVAVPLYIISWISFTWISGGYDHPLRILKTIRGLAIGTLIILVVYGMLDEAHRYSRFLTLVGAGWAAISATGIRMVYNLFRFKSFFPEDGTLKRILIVGEELEATRIAALLNQSPVKTSYVGIVSPRAENSATTRYAGDLSRLREMVEIFGINELIFCGKDLSSAQIMDQMMKINHPELEYKIAPPESLFIIGSNSIQTSGELYTIGLNSVAKPSNKRKKRIFDLSVSILMILLFPVTLLFIPNGLRALLNAWQVFTGKLSWIGYSESEKNISLPKLDTGILHPLDPYAKESYDEKIKHQTNLLYAKDYRIQQDLLILLNSWKQLGRKDRN